MLCESPNGPNGVATNTDILEEISTPAYPQVCSNPVGAYCFMHCIFFTRAVPLRNNVLVRPPTSLFPTATSLGWRAERRWGLEQRSILNGELVKSAQQNATYHYEVFGDFKPTLERRKPIPAASQAMQTLH